MHIVLITLVLLIAVIVILRNYSNFERLKSDVDPESDLVGLCMGDREQADRLIQGELDRYPTISRREAAARARYAYRRDNR